MNYSFKIEDLRLLVSVLAIVMSVITFILYVMRSRSDKDIAAQLENVTPKTTSGQGFAPSNIADITAFTKALAELGGALVKLSPSVIALVASILFLAIASLSTGALQSSTPEPKSKTQEPTVTGLGNSQNIK